MTALGFVDPPTVPIPRVHGDETGGDIDKGRIESRGL